MLSLNALSYIYYIQRFNNIDFNNSFKNYDVEKLFKYLENIKDNILLSCIFKDNLVEVLNDTILYNSESNDIINTIIDKLNKHNIVNCIIKDNNLLYKITINNIDNHNYNINIYNKNIDLFENNKIYDYNDEISPQRGVIILIEL